MSWDNFGKVWELDHVIPIAWFDLKDKSQVKKCFHYSNFQPLLCFDNRSKNADLKKLASLVLIARYMKEAA
jgi:hypothetical protein